MNHPVWTQLSPAVLKVAVHFLLAANYKPDEWYDGARIVAVPAGSFVTSYAKMAAACRLSVQQIRDAFDHLERTQFATYVKTHRWTRVTVKNWAIYQSAPEDGNTPENSFGTGKRTTDKEEKKKTTKTCASPDGDARDPQPDTPSEASEERASFPREPKSRDTSKDLFTLQEAWFNEWWAEYWLRKSKEPARRAFRKHVRTEAQFRQVMAATKEQKQEMLGRERQHRPYGATWLNDKRWEDETTPDESPRVATGPTYQKWDPEREA